MYTYYVRAALYGISVDTFNDAFEKSKKVYDKAEKMSREMTVLQSDLLPQR